MKFVYCIVAIATLVSQVYCANNQLSDDYSDWNIPAPCTASDPGINECLKNYFQIFWNTHANAQGSPKLRLPPLDPFTIKKSKWSYKNPFFEFVFLTKNLKISNMAETTIHKVHAQLNDTKRIIIELDMSDPEVILESDYKVKARVGDQHLRPSGHFKCKIEKIHNIAKTVGVIEDRNGHRYMKIKAVDFRPQIQNFKIEMQNAHTSPNMDSLLTDLINNNVKAFYKDFIVASKSEWEPIILEVLNDFWANFPIELMIIF